MIIIDTKVVSEFMRHVPAPAVTAWMNRQVRSELRLTAVTVAELRAGLRQMTQGRRQRRLEEQFDRMLTLAFSSEVLSFDLGAAEMFAVIRASRAKAGRPIATLDAQIAAIARALAATIATRNLSDFEGCGVELINPFEFAG